MRKSALLAILAVFAASAVVSAQESGAYWPLERKDRYGTAKATRGPVTFATPWISYYLSGGWLGTASAAIGSGTTGYYDCGAEHLLKQINYKTGDITGSYSTAGDLTGMPAIASTSSVLTSVNSPAAQLLNLDPWAMTPTWTNPDCPIVGSITIGPDNAIVFFQADGTLVKLDRTTNTEIWHVSDLGTPGGTPVFTRDNLKVIVGGGNDAWAVDYATGDVVWHTDLGSQAGQATASKSGNAIIGSDAGQIYGLRLFDGKILWTDSTGGSQRNPVAIDVGYAYATGGDGLITKLDAKTGAVIWSYPAGSPFTCPPVIGFDSRVYAFDAAGDFFSLTPDGTLVWTANLGGAAVGPFSISPDGTLFVCRGGDPHQNLAGMVLLREIPGLVKGRVAFKDFLGTLPTSFVADLRTRGSLNVESSAVAGFDSTRLMTANFAMPFHAVGDGAQGKFDFSFKTGSWLRKTIPVDLRPGFFQIPTPNLINGDVVDDNVVDLLDLTAVVLAWHTHPGDLLWNPRADVNGDGYVDPKDKQIVLRNQGQVGDN